MNNGQKMAFILESRNGYIRCSNLAQQLSAVSMSVNLGSSTVEFFLNTHFAPSGTRDDEK